MSESSMANFKCKLIPQINIGEYPKSIRENLVKEWKVLLLKEFKSQYLLKKCTTDIGIEFPSYAPVDEFINSAIFDALGINLHAELTMKPTVYCVFGSGGSAEIVCYHTVSVFRGARTPEGRHPMRVSSGQFGYDLQAVFAYPMPQSESIEDGGEHGDPVAEALLEFANYSEES